jgi:hypothetical protein
MYFQWLSIMLQFGTVLGSYQGFYMLYAIWLKEMIPKHMLGGIPKHMLGGIAPYFLQKHL